MRPQDIDKKLKGQCVVTKFSAVKQVAIIGLHFVQIFSLTCLLYMRNVHGLIETPRGGGVLILCHHSFLKLFVSLCSPQISCINFLYCSGLIYSIVGFKSP